MERESIPLIDEVFKLVYDKTDGPYEAVNILVKTIFAIMKYSDLDYDNEAEYHYTNLFKSENVQKTLDGIKVEVIEKE